MGRLTWNIVWKYHQPKFLTHLPKYLIGKPFHLSGILGVAASSARVSIKLGGLWGDHSSSHRRLNIVSLVSLSTTEPCSHVKEGTLAFKESHPGQDCLMFWSLTWATSEPGTLVELRCPGDTAGGSCETSGSSHSWEEGLHLNLLTKYRKCTHLQKAALQVNPESVARSITSDLRMNPLNAHCIVKLYNIYIGITGLQKWWLNCSFHSKFLYLLSEKYLRSNLWLDQVQEERHPTTHLT